eukprot:IDg11398t1
MLAGSTNISTTAKPHRRCASKEHHDNSIATEAASYPHARRRPRCGRESAAAERTRPRSPGTLFFSAPCLAHLMRTPVFHWRLTLVFCSLSYSTPAVPTSSQTLQPPPRTGLRGNWRLTKRCSTSRLGAASSLAHAQSLENDTTRVSLCEPTAMGMVSKSTGDGRRLPRGIAGKGCNCTDRLDKLQPKFEATARTERERRSMDARNQSGKASRIGCTRGLRSRRLGVSNSFLRDVHARAIAAAKTPIKTMTKAEIGRNRDRLLPRIVLPTGAVRSRGQIFDQTGSGEVFRVLVERERMHGLVGRPSNRSFTEERGFFAHLSARTGRRLVAHRITPAVITEQFNISMQDGLQYARRTSGLRGILDHALSRTARRRRRQNTLLYTRTRPTPAVLVSVSVGDLRTNKQTLFRHKQQSDRTLPRLAAINEHEIIGRDLAAELAQHTAEASAASRHYKRCIKSAAYIYEDLCIKYNALLQNGQAVTIASNTKFAQEAAGSWFDVASDYQQDKWFPRGTVLPSPGRHDDTKRSRNIVYVREENIGGAKCSDDTLSTLADALLGRRRPACPQPSLHRSGYDKDGIIV